MTGVLYWLTALACESAPIRKRYGMAAVEGGEPFRIYRNEPGTHWLVESGIGRVNAAAATMSLYYLAGSVSHASWLNVGIAAHRDYPIGEGRLVNQIVDESTGRTAYPMPVFKSPVDGARLTTTDRVVSEPEPRTLYDMEGAAFFEIAARLSSSERTMLFKVVSDHGVTPGTFPSKHAVSRLIENQVDRWDLLASELLILSGQEAERLAHPQGYEMLVERFHFSSSLKYQLKDMLRRFNLLVGPNHLAGVVDGARNAREVMSCLKKRLDGIHVDWGHS